MLNKAYYSFKKDNLKKPIYLIFFVTNQCNSKCKHCFYSHQLNKNKEDLLTLEQIDLFSKGLDKLIWLAISGGEPFMREDLDKICEIFHDNNQINEVGIPTNGILTDVIYEKTKKILESGKIKKVTISLSLDGTKEIHNEVRGVDCFEKVFETYNRLAELKNQYPNLLLKVCTTLSNKNVNVIPNLIKEVKERMPKLDFHNFEIMRGNPLDKNYGPPTIGQIENLKPLLFRTANEYTFVGKKNFKSRIAINAKKIVFNSHIKTLKEKRQLLPCYAGKVHCVLDYNGDIYMCELGPKVGNIKQESFESLWHSAKAQSMRKFIADKKCYCTHSCFQNTNISFNHKLWSKFVLS